jgi:hypothetical protein
VFGSSIWVTNQPEFCSWICVHSCFLA